MFSVVASIVIERANFADCVKLIWLASSFPCEADPLLDDRPREPERERVSQEDGGEQRPVESGQAEQPVRHPRGRRLQQEQRREQQRDAVQRARAQDDAWRGRKYF